MKNEIIEACNLPEGNKVYMKRDSYSDGGWKVVYPWKDKDGNWLWKNVLCGGSQNLFWIIFIILLIFGFMYVYTHDTIEMQKVVEDPCNYCSQMNILKVNTLEDGILERQEG